MLFLPSDGEVHLKVSDLCHSVHLFKKIKQYLYYSDLMESPSYIQSRDNFSHQYMLRSANAFHSQHLWSPAPSLAMIRTFACFVNVRASGPAQDGNDMS